jgi:hypothetical protein
MYRKRVITIAENRSNARLSAIASHCTLSSHCAHGVSRVWVSTTTWVETVTLGLAHGRTGEPNSTAFSRNIGRVSEKVLNIIVFGCVHKGTW